MIENWCWNIWTDKYFIRLNWPKSLDKSNEQSLLCIRHSVSQISKNQACPKIYENLIDFWRSKICLTFMSHWFLEISCADHDIVPLIFGDIRYKYVSKNQWDISLAMDFIDFIDFQRYSQLQTCSQIVMFLSKIKFYEIYQFFV